MTSAILMDIGNVLIDFDVSKLLAGIAQAAGRPQRDILLFLLRSGLAEKYEKGLVSTADFFKRVSQEIGYTGPFEPFRDSFNDIFKENAAGVAAFRALKAQLPVLLASNTNQMHYEFICKRFDFLKEATGHVLSHQVHFRKPEPMFFRKALLKAGVGPEEALVIDDSPENVQGAKALGIPGIVFKDAGSLKEALKAFNLVI